MIDITFEELPKAMSKLFSEISDIKSILSKGNNSELEDRFLSKKEAAKLCGCAVSTIDNLRRKGILKTYRLSTGETKGNPVFLRSEVIEAIKSM